MKKVEKIKRICKTCGEEFYVYPSTFKKDGCNYCNRECFWTDFRKNMKLSGKGSGAKGKHWKHTDEYNKKLSESKIGSLNPMWKGGLSLIRSRYKRPFKHTIWRRKVLERDNYICRECGKRGGLLNAHHIEPWATNKKLRYLIRNGVTLCFKCHQYIHWNEIIINKSIINYESR
jgi:hypothetical protein